MNTGLTDKNGVEIKAGDWVSLDGNMTTDDSMGILPNEQFFREEIKQVPITVETADGQQLTVKEVIWEEDAEGIFAIKVIVARPDKKYFVHCDTCHECAEMPGDGVPEEFNAAHLGHALRVASIP